MKVNKKIRSNIEKVDSYIEELETELLRKETSSMDRFIKASNKVATVFSEDLELLAQGKLEECTLLTANNQDKTVERIMLMLKSTELFESISKAAEGLVPEVVNEAQDLKIQIKDDENAFEELQKRVKKNVRG